MKKLSLVVSLAALLSACGASPTAPTERPIPAGTITAANDLSISGCLNNQCDSFSVTVTNTGVGCVSPQDLAGTITLTKTADGRQSTANWELTLGDKATDPIRPGQSRTAVRSSGSLYDPPGAGTWTFAVTKQTNMRCQ